MSDRRDIVCFSSLDWGFLRQTPQEMMSALARRGHRVLYIENTGIRTPRPDDLGRVLDRAANLLRHRLGGLREVEPDLHVLPPFLLPLFRNQAVRRLNRRLLSSGVRRAMEKLGMGDPIVWIFLPGPSVMEVLGDLRAGRIVFAYLDRFSRTSRAAAYMEALEVEACRRADLVLAASYTLHQRARRHSNNARLLLPGTELTGAPDLSPSRFQTGLTFPASGSVIGYVGGVKEWLDQEILIHLARSRPQWTVVVLGSLMADVTPLRAVPNIYLPGEVAHASLPATIDRFDVGVIPWKLTDYTQEVFPLKLMEYLARGKPVVSTPLENVLRFNEEHGEVVRIAAEPESFLAAVEAALEEGDRRQEERKAVARRHSWEGKVRVIETLLARLP